MPLAPLDPAANGGTAFELGSHVARLLDALGRENRAKDADPSARDRLPVRAAPAPAPGDVYVYDLRVRHYGLPHVAGPPRPLLSFPFVKDWYQDAVNHPSRHTDAYADVAGDTLRKLLVRVDARQHHEDLFAAVREGTCEVA